MLREAKIKAAEAAILTTAITAKESTIPRPKLIQATQHKADGKVKMIPGKTLKVKKILFFSISRKSLAARSAEPISTKETESLAIVTAITVKAPRPHM